MSKYRTKLQIVAEILEIVKGGAKKTHIMYKANLSYKLLCKYLEEVLKCGFVKVDPDGGYAVSSRGCEFLDRFEAYRSRRKVLSHELSEVEEERKSLEEMYSSSMRGYGKR